MNELGKNYDIDFRKTVEQQVLGPIISFSESNEVTALIKKHNLLPSDFYAPIHRDIFRTILECYEKKILPNIVNVSHLRPTEYRENNSRYWEYPIIDITQRTIGWASLETHIMLLKQFVLMDYWNRQSHNILYGNWNDKDVINIGDEVITSYKNLFSRLTTGITKDDENDYATEIIMKVERRNAGKPVGIPSGIPGFDERASGWSLGELIIIAARPGMGKTTLALITAWNAAINGTYVVFFSLEMPKNQLISKLVSLITQISYLDIKAGRLTNEELQQVLSARTYIENSNLHIDDKSKTIEDIIEKSAEYVKTLGARLFFMDYIQRCTSRTKMEIRHLIILISRELKSIAKEHYVAFIALSQLSRAVEQRPNKRPKLSDLKESSSIEEDADLVGFLYTQAYYDKQEGNEPGYAELFHSEFIIGKGRDVGTFTIHIFLEPVKMFIAKYNYEGVYEQI
jgi:replicative DNA helicase